MNEPEEQRDSSDEPATDLFVALLMENRHRIYAFIAKQLVNPADVEDVFQKTSVVLWRKMQQYDRESSFFHWACGIAFHEVLNFRKVQKRGKLQFDSELVQLLAEEAAQEEALSEARLAALRVCMKSLSERQQEILRRCYMGGDTITDVASGLGRQRGALYKQLARLREKLQHCIRKRIALAGAKS